MFTYVAKTIAGYGAQIGDESGPIMSYGVYYSYPYDAEKDAIDWAFAENCPYKEFNWRKYWDEFDKK